MNQILIRDATLVDLQSGERLEGRHVLIEGETIAEVSDRPIAAATAHRIDLAGWTLLPGLIDAHVHVIAVTTDLAALARIPPYLVAAQAKAVLEGMLVRGFTSVRDAGGADWGLVEA